MDIRYSYKKLLEEDFNSDSDDLSLNVNKINKKQKTSHKVIIVVFGATILIPVICLIFFKSVIAGDEALRESQNIKKHFFAPVWTYDCLNSKCVRVQSSSPPVSLKTCNMLCPFPSIWPKPVSFSNAKNSNISTFNKHQIVFKIISPPEVENDLIQAANIFMDNLPIENMPRTEILDIESFKIHLNVTSSEKKIKIFTNETYSLEIEKFNKDILVNITAETYFGARNGLESLNQLIWLDSLDKKVKVYYGVKVIDWPKFKHRGLMVDTARNYFPISSLLKVLDGMAASKLNALHLHLTDAVSFPIVLPNNRIFSETGAYGSDMIYTENDIKELIEYARIRGIRVILEIDSPSHVNEGWNHGNEKLVICSEDDQFHGHLNPDNKNTLPTLQSIYQDLILLGTDKETFHIGSDEVNINCWNKTIAARKYSDIYLFWVSFINQMLDTLKAAFNNSLPKNIVLWSSPLTNDYLPGLKYKENLVVQFWLGEIDNIVDLGYKIIFSTVNHWYLDCGFGPWELRKDYGDCDPYTSWRKFYAYRPWFDYNSTKIKQVLGGETCLWTEEVSVDDLETRIWPRAAAAAERLWSDPESYELSNVANRLSIFSKVLKNKGLKVAAIWPKWCTLNPGKC